VGKCLLHTNGTSSGTSKLLVSVGSGVVFDDFCEWAAKEGLWGVENLSYIPGEVGASAVQNIGAYGVEVKDVIHKVYCYDTLEEEFVSFSVEECGYGYRDSIFKKPEVKGRYIVTHVVFALSREPKPCLEYGHLREAVANAASLSSDPRLPAGRHPLAEGGMSLPSDTTFVPTPAQIRKAIIKIRKEKLPEPSVKGSAGSFFKNPVISAEHFAKIEAAAKAELGADYKVPHYALPDGTVKVPAAWMIEQCGWKGKRSGGAAVWDKQPLVIVNYTGEAYPEEIIGLEKRIIASVKAKFGVDLHPEVEHV
jgi:UDP-N-acetylmuramate dehydrogenase